MYSQLAALGPTVTSAYTNGAEYSLMEEQACHDGLIAFDSRVPDTVCECTAKTFDLYVPNWLGLKQWLQGPSIIFTGLTDFFP